MNQIQKINLSNFLTGMVFWYGIEKLFMQSIGLDTVAVGSLTVIMIALNLVLDIPSGMLADKWSRKGVLMISAVALALCSVVLGSSKGYLGYAMGYVLYAVYVVSTSGTYQAITYDYLHEQGRQKEYSKVVGLAYALFLSGCGVANIASGLIASRLGYDVPFFATVIPCFLNLFVIASMVEPTFHKPENKEKIVRQLLTASKVISKINLLRTLAIVMSLVDVVELFKSDFGQFYMLRYFQSPTILGFLWAIYAFGWALGGFVAHRLHSRLNLLVIAASLPVIAMGFVDSKFSLVFFMIQTVAAGALVIQIESRVQDETPSHVRASVLSVLSSIGRVISIPASLAYGWLLKNQGAFIAMRWVGAIAAVMLIYWAYFVVSSVKIETSPT